ncbi:GCN5-related N-acetyltransferase 10, chloroplastic isoform X2 [Cornus florida]|uniref:GCN5-related N-acetyltransferase 10, chloroplastic isoform X2 n=1 Tax=Cornus florida TaxID=4283 RepID=UPI0028A1772D|nr:GCN5-related N-acetyltransferase 10, chloroplastic isoform X2 [Cornus florida]
MRKWSGKENDLFAPTHTPTPPTHTHKHKIKIAMYVTCYTKKALTQQELEMAYLQQKYLNISKGICGEFSCGYRGTKHDRVGLNDWRLSWKNAGQIGRFSENTRILERERGSYLQRFSSSSPTSSAEEVEWQYGYLATEYGWKVRRMVEKEDEMRKVAQVQAEAFHVPVFFFNDLFFQYFQAEVLSGLLYRLRNSAPDRYACLVAETVDATKSESRKELVGVVDVTVFRDEAVLQHLPGAEEYLYISGIAVLNKFS